MGAARRLLPDGLLRADDLPARTRHAGAAATGPGRGGCREGTETQDLALVALGSVKKASTDTVVLKKVVLSGSPFKVRSKLATVRHMFYEPRDVLVRLARASHG